MFVNITHLTYESNRAIDELNYKSNKNYSQRHVYTSPWSNLGDVPSYIRKDCSVHSYSQSNGLIIPSFHVNQN